jgi:L-seryl-tRNA(Ser) seleniumtransferase
MSNDLYKTIPQLEKLLNDDGFRSLCSEFSRLETVEALRAELDDARQKIRDQGDPVLPDFSGPEFLTVIREAMLLRRERSLRKVINATGIILHTNLGRAPLANDAIEAIKEAALGYSNLEFNLESGKRGSRYMHIEEALINATGAEAAVVVNNCAAAVLVSLNTLAKDKEVIVSRGELIEIGGGFRMPDVIAATGALMREVGTTNKTHLADYEQAINDNSRVILRNHCSNYKIVGFTRSPSTPELVQLAHQRGLYMVEDLGSGALIDLEPFGIHGERTVQQILADGMDLVLFSGDKLMGGPQAGIIVGAAEPIAMIKKNPLLRAMRIDKLSLAALEATLVHYLDPKQALDQIPILSMIASTKEEIEVRTMRLVKKLENNELISASIQDDTSFVGGGSAPMNELPSCVLKLAYTGSSAESVTRRLRKLTPAVIARISDDTLVLDLRTVFPEQEDTLLAALEAVAG